MFHTCVSRPTEILHSEVTRGGVVTAEIKRRNITSVEEDGEPVVVFSTNCEFSFVFIQP